MGPGTVVADRYEVVRLLARGGMADVYEARDRRSGDRVAIKVLREGLSKDGEVVARFQREVRAVSSLKSKHVVRVFDCGTTGKSRPFMVLEFLAGADLGKELAKRGALPLAEAAQYLTHACHAMIEAHEAGIIHRDLKPSNLVLAEDAGKRVLKIVDFGISKLRRDTQTEDITNTRALFGSPLYMSPETFRAAKAADERSDIWSLGVIFYEMITGEAPFSGENALAVGLAVTRHAHTPPSLRKPGLPGATDVVIARALKKDPKERYQTMRELLAALEVFTPRGRNETMAIPRVADREVDDEPRTAKRELITELGMRSLPSLTDEPATRVVEPDEDEHDKPTRSVTLDAFAAVSQGSLGANVEGPTRVREAAAGPYARAASTEVVAAPRATSEPGATAATPSIGRASSESLAPEPPAEGRKSGPGADSEPEAGRSTDTGRIESPMSVTNAPSTAPPKASRKTALWVAAAAAVFGLGGWLIAKSGDDAGAASSATTASQPSAAVPGTAHATATATAQPAPQPSGLASSAPEPEPSASSAVSASAGEPSAQPEPEPSASVAATAPRPRGKPTGKAKPQPTFVPKGI